MSQVYNVYCHTYLDDIALGSSHHRVVAEAPGEAACNVFRSLIQNGYLKFSAVNRPVLKQGESDAQ